MKKIATIVGARPQFIKAATVSRIISSKKDLKEILVHTGQHYDSNMSKIFFEELDIKTPDFHLGIGGGTYGQNTGRMIEAIERLLVDINPDCVLVYGDTDSTLAATLAAAKMHIPVAHVEAGLRSFNRRMPEELNRVLTDHAASILFAPTGNAMSNLLKEGIDENTIHLVGDVMYDASLFYRRFAKKPTPLSIENGRPFYLCTIHRAENTDDKKRLLELLNFINNLSKEKDVILPLHPRTSKSIQSLDSFHFLRSVHSIEPVSYFEMTWLVANSDLVITDSGGLQKEAYFHYKPCVTLRGETEWVELVQSGWNLLLNSMSIDSFEAFETNNRSADKSDIFGQGNAAKLIVDILYKCK
jgi:UDP-GlcNAc3NAcA epimerase